MLLCLFILAISFILIIVSILMLKNAISIRNQVQEQLQTINDEPDIFLDFFK